jgi:PAS domain-containing protein
MLCVHPSPLARSSDLESSPVRAAVRPSGARADAARATMEALADSPDVFEEFFVSARIGLALADLNGSYVRVNRTYAELLGRLPEDLVGVRLADVLEDALASTSPSWPAGAGTPCRASRPTRTPTGRPPGCCKAWRRSRGPAAVRRGSPSARRTSPSGGARRRSSGRDRGAHRTGGPRPLTGLANRTLFEERLRGALSRTPARAGRPECCSWTSTASRTSTTRRPRVGDECCVRSPTA